jgi:hypothetical protein
MRLLPFAYAVLALGCSKDPGGDRAAPTPAPSPPPAPTPADTIDPAALARGKAVVGELKQTLLARLNAALPQGAAGALAVCSGEAPAIAAGLSKDGALVGRATRKPRNPANAATGWQADALALFEAKVARKEQLAGATFARRLADGRIAYAEPLVIVELCTTCHGTAIAPDVQAVLAERYPTDQATGYAVGDLRGVAWAELPAH